MLGAPSEKRILILRSAKSSKIFAVAAYHHRQMAVLTRAQRLNWLDAVVPEDELLRPMPMGS
jgi:putative SOS response-associated peptidase YedK